MPRDAEAPDLSPIRETENALIVSVPVSRRKKTPIDRSPLRLLSLVSQFFFPVGIIAIGLFIGEEIGSTWIVLGIFALLFVSGIFIVNEINLATKREILEVDAERIILRYGIRSKAQVFEANRLHNLRFSKTVYHIPLNINFGRGFPLLKEHVDPDSYAILCDYDGESTSLLGWLEKPLAEEILRRIQERFPGYRE